MFREQPGSHPEHGGAGGTHAVGDRWTAPRPALVPMVRRIRVQSLVHGNRSS